MPRVHRDFSDKLASNRIFDSVEDRALDFLFRAKPFGKKTSIRENFLMGVLKTSEEVAEGGIQTKQQADVMKAVFDRTDPVVTQEPDRSVHVVFNESDSGRPFAPDRNPTASRGPKSDS